MVGCVHARKRHRNTWLIIQIQRVTHGRPTFQRSSPLLRPNEFGKGLRAAIAVWDNHCRLRPLTSSSTLMPRPKNLHRITTPTSVEQQTADGRAYLNVCPQSPRCNHHQRRHQRRHQRHHHRCHLFHRLRLHQPRALWQQHHCRHAHCRNNCVCQRSTKWPSHHRRCHAIVSMSRLLLIAAPNNLCGCPLCNHLLA
jgi:hypothetical protein